LQELAAGGLLPLPMEQLLPLQVTLARGEDVDISALATQSLRETDPRLAAPFLAREAEEEVLDFFALEVGHPLIVETILRRRDTPRRLLVEMARRLPADLQEILLLRQDAILEEPAILDALGENRQITPYTQRRIVEYREHLLPQRSFFRSSAEIIEEAEAMPEEVLAAEVEAVRQLPAEGEVEEKTGLSEGQIRMLAVPARIRLTKGASRVMRSILIRDSNSLVAVSVLTNNSLSDQELEQTSRSRAVCEEVLTFIAKKRDWVGKYAIARGLVGNPKTALNISMRLLPRMSVRDLREIGRDRNVPDALRSNALRLYTAKQK
ncbi:MAG TPA: hypothetical protein VGE98_08450, partial [Thermoanaerobaculia bacterium]